MARTVTQQKNTKSPEALPALVRAATRALELGIATNTPVWVMENGKIVDIAKRERRKRQRAKR